MACSKASDPLAGADNGVRFWRLSTCSAYGFSCVNPAPPPAWRTGHGTPAWCPQNAGRRRSRLHSTDGLQLDVDITAGGPPAVLGGGQGRRQDGDLRRSRTRRRDVATVTAVARLASVGHGRCSAIQRSSPPMPSKAARAARASASVTPDSPAAGASEYYTG